MKKKYFIALVVSVVTLTASVFVSNNSKIFWKNIFADLAGGIGTEIEDFSIVTTNAIASVNSGTTVTLKFAALLGDDFPNGTTIDGISFEIFFPNSYTPFNPQVTNKSNGTLFDTVSLVSVPGGKKATVTFYDLELIDSGNIFNLSVDYSTFATHTLQIFGEVLTTSKNVYELGSMNYLIKGVSQITPDASGAAVVDSTNAAVVSNIGGGGSSGGSGGGGGGSLSSTSKNSKSSTKGTTNSVLEDIVDLNKNGCTGDKESPFSDIIGHFSQKSVGILYNKGVISGYANNIFKPDQSVTRAEFTKMVLTTLGYNLQSHDIVASVGEQKYFAFKDLKPGHWAYNYIYTAYIQNIVSGYNDGKFMPNKSISRAEAVKIVLFAAKISVIEGLTNIFTDVADDWYVDVIKTAHYYKFINGYGDGTFGPNDEITRGEAAVVLANSICGQK